MTRLAQLDQAHVWHPFTQMRDWLRAEPRVIVAGEGSLLYDEQGREYLDANSSLDPGPTSTAMRRHPRDQRRHPAPALRRKWPTPRLWGLNEPAASLAAELVRVARLAGAQAGLSNPALPKVFFSDDGSTALEVALKLAYEFTRRTRGPKARPRFLSRRARITATQSGP